MSQFSTTMFYLFHSKSFGIETILKRVIKNFPSPSTPINTSPERTNLLSDFVRIRQNLSGVSKILEIWSDSMVGIGKQGFQRLSYRIRLKQLHLGRRKPPIEINTYLLFSKGLPSFELCNRRRQSSHRFTPLFICNSLSYI